MSITETVSKMHRIYTTIANLDQLSMASTYCYLMINALDLDCDARNVLVAYKSQLFNDAILRLTE